MASMLCNTPKRIMEGTDAAVPSDRREDGASMATTVYVVAGRELRKRKIDKKYLARKRKKTWWEVWGWGTG